MNDLMFYIKTTETCNLHCDHCYTSGKNGRKIFFDPIKTADWVNQFSQHASFAHFEFHGGEPFLAPLGDMFEFYDRVRGVWKNHSFGCTSNLVLKLTEERLDFIDQVLGWRIGTSWDPNIRFANPGQKELWESNVRMLKDLGVTIKVFVSLSVDVVQMEPINILKYFKDLGVDELAFERLTSDGNAVKNRAIFPSNLDLQHWYLKLHEQTTEHGARDWISNDFLESIYSKFEEGKNNEATFCRDCEQKLFTINADGTVAGCPNTAPKDFYTTIESTFEEVQINTKRCTVIAKETARDPRCFECDVFKYCNGDCHQLDWEDDICAAPKLLMRELRNDSWFRQHN